MFLIHTGYKHGSFLEGVLRRMAEEREKCIMIPIAPRGAASTPLSEQLVRISKGVLIDAREFSFSHPLSQISDWAREHSGFPVVATGRDLEDIACVNFDNREAMKKVTLHFLDTHGSKAPLFLAGNSSNQSAEARRLGFLEGCEARGINGSERIVFGGAFTTTAGASQTKAIIDADREFDAILCSSDRQANGMRLVFQELGKKVPPHSGFDNELFHHERASSLSTVHLDDSRLGYEGADLLIQMARGKNDLVASTSRSIRLTFLPRASCGCKLETASPFWNESECARILVSPERIRKGRAVFESWSSREPQFLRKWETWSREEASFPNSIPRLRSFLYCLAVERRVFGMKFMEKILNQIEDEMNTTIMEEKREREKDLYRLLSRMFTKPGPDSMRSALDGFFTKSKVLHWHLKLTRDSPEESNTELEFLRTVLTKEPTVVNLPFISAGEPIASLTWSQPKAIASVGEIMHLVLMGYLMSEAAIEKEHRTMLRLKDAVDLLEQHNIRLKATSESDPMTGFLNRLGFMNRAQPLWQKAKENKRPCLFLFADLDGLKGINDHFGHQAGDEAIKAGGLCLSRSLRSIDLTCRLGGDEFVALLIGIDEGALPIIHQRLRTNLDEWNLAKAYPWKLAMSLGGCQRPETDHITFEGHMALADQRLYENKKARALKRGETPT